MTRPELISWKMRRRNDPRSPKTAASTPAYTQTHMFRQTHTSIGVLVLYIHEVLLEVFFSLKSSNKFGETVAKKQPKKTSDREPNTFAAGIR